MLKEKFRKILPVLFAFTLLLSLAGLFVSGLFLSDNEYSETENRYLASAPVLTVNSLVDGSFMEKAEAYLSDQFVARNSIVSIKALISRIMGKTMISEVYIGKNNRLFEVGSLVDEQKLTATVDAINKFTERSEIENSYVLLAPNAEDIYKEELPVFLASSYRDGLIGNIYSRLDENNICLDVTDALNTNRQENLYFLTDHHWTADAAFIAFKELARLLDIEYDKSLYERFVFSSSFSGTLASSSGVYEATDELCGIFPVAAQGTYYVQNYDTQEKSASVFDFSRLDNKNQYEVFFGGNFSRIIIRTENMNEKNLLIFKDSYANCFIPLLIPHFESIVIIDPRYYTENIDFVLQDTKFSHLLYLYNLNTFLEDTSLKDVIA